jgi:TRAP-type C4-dicarboxylate transport system permease large subunit
MGPLSRALIPFLLLLIGLLLLFTLVPALSLALPNAVFGEI